MRASSIERLTVATRLHDDKYIIFDSDIAVTGSSRSSSNETRDTLISDIAPEDTEEHEYKFTLILLILFIHVWRIQLSCYHLLKDCRFGDFGIRGSK